MNKYLCNGGDAAGGCRREAVPGLLPSAGAGTFTEGGGGQSGIDPAGL